VHFHPCYRRCTVHHGELFRLGGSRFFNFQLCDDPQDVVLQFAKGGIIRTEFHTPLHLLKRRTEQVNQSESGGSRHSIRFDAQMQG